MVPKRKKKKTYITSVYVRVKETKNLIKYNCWLKRSVNILTTWIPIRQLEFYDCSRIKEEELYGEIWKAEEKSSARKMAVILFLAGPIVCFNITPRRFFVASLRWRHRNRITAENHSNLGGCNYTANTHTNTLVKRTSKETAGKLRKLLV